MPAEGDAVELLVKYRQGDKDFTVPAWRWMVTAEDREMAPKSLKWVFAGSRRIQGTKLAAETEDVASSEIAGHRPLVAEGDVADTGLARPGG